MGLNYWLSPYTANKTTKTTHVYVQQVGGHPSHPRPPSQHQQQIQYVQPQPGQHVQHVYHQPGVVQPAPLQQNIHHQQPVYHPPPHQQPVYQQPVHQQPVHQQPVYQQPIHQQQPIRHDSYHQVPPTPQAHYQQPSPSLSSQYSHPSPSLSSQYSQQSSPALSTQYTPYHGSVPSTPYMANQHPLPPSYSSPPAHHATLLTQPFSHDKFPPAPVFHPYEDKKKPFESVDTAQFPNMPMPKPVKTYPQKPEVIHVEKERPAQQQEASILSPVSAGPRNPQFVAPVYKNPQTFNDSPDITTGCTTVLAHSMSSKAPHAVVSALSHSTQASHQPLSSNASNSSSSSNTMRPVSTSFHSSHSVATGTTSRPASTLVHSSSSSSSTTSTATSQPYKPQPYQPSSTKTLSATSQPSNSSSAQLPPIAQSNRHDNSFINNFESMSISSARRDSNISTVPNRIFVDSKDDIPRLFLIAPTFEEPLIKGPYKPVRILLPCQAPSAYYGGEDAVHMTSHNGYTIKNPNDFLHNNKDAVKMMGTIASYFAVAANVVASIQGVPGYGGDVAAAAAASLAQTADNRAHLNTTGLDTNSIYEKHMATENHQREALKILLRAASAADPTQSMTGELNGVVLNNGKTIWVCKECYDLMLKGESVKRDYHVSLRDYDSLTRRDPSINVLLRCSASLIIFTNALRSHPYPQRVSIRIAPEYFEAPERSHRAALASIQSLFNDLGTVLYRQRITSLEIQGKSETGYVYASLQNVLRCPSLEQLAILGMPLFLQGSDMPKECRLLRKLVLDGVRVDTEQAANNLCALIFANQSLTNLRLTRASFTKVALDTLHFDINKQNVRLFKNFTHLNLSENNLDVVSATTFVTMAFKSFDLTHLDISGNPRIGDSGCRAILTLLRQRNKKLVELNTERTGIEWRTKDEIKQLLNIPQ